MTARTPDLASTLTEIPELPPPSPEVLPAPPRHRLTALVAGVALLAALLGAAAGGVTVFAALSAGGRLDPAPASDGRMATASGESDRIVAAAATVRPSVVQIDVEGGKGAGNGSGVVYRSDGYIITNHHVVSAAAALTVRFADGAEVPGVVVGADRGNDLAVLHVDHRPLTPIVVGDSSELSVGELAIAVGSPFGLDGSVTAGIVSAVERGPIRVRAPDGAAVSLMNVLQTDASVNPGNSGGPLVDGEGRMIGITSAILTRDENPGNAGVAFAIPADLAVRVADGLIEKSETPRPAFLGISGPAGPDRRAQRAGGRTGGFRHGGHARGGRGDRGDVSSRTAACRGGTRRGRDVEVGRGRRAGQG